MNPVSKTAASSRNKSVRIAVVAVALSALPIAALATGVRESNDKKTKPDAPRYIAVRFHADWCATCDQLVPQYGKLLATTKDLSVLFVTLDMTSDVTRRQSEFLAGKLKIGRVWAEQRDRVGVIKLIDAQDKRVVETINIGGGHKKVEAAIRRVASKEMS